jgi:hypothetical protein
MNQGNKTAKASYRKSKSKPTEPSSMHSPEPLTEPKPRALVRTKTPGPHILLAPGMTFPSRCRKSDLTRSSTFPTSPPKDSSYQTHKLLVSQEQVSKKNPAGSKHKLPKGCPDTVFSLPYTPKMTRETLSTSSGEHRAHLTTAAEPTYPRGLECSQKRLKPLSCFAIAV